MIKYSNSSTLAVHELNYMKKMQLDIGSEPTLKMARHLQ